MFNSKQKAKGGNVTQYSGQASLIAAGANVAGDIVFQGAVIIEGVLRGKLETVDGMVVVNQNGSVEGEIIAPHVEIKGTVIGDIRASHNLSLGQHAKIRGNMTYGVISIAEGAKFEGSMSPTDTDSNILEIPYQHNNEDSVVEVVDNNKKKK